MTPRFLAGTAAGAGTVTALAIALLPAATIELIAWRLWLPDLIAAATPPIGATGRSLLALAGGVAMAGLVAGLLVAMQRWPRRTARSDMPSVRRADAHPDAPPRRPIRAGEDLGPPLPILAVKRARPLPEPERPLPADLDQPLVDFDPSSAPDAPRQPVRALPSLAPAAGMVPKPAEEAPPAPVTEAETGVEAPRAPTAAPANAAEAPPPARPATIDPGERFETFALPAPVAMPARAAVAARGEAPGDGSIAALLDRLERSAARRTVEASFPARPEPAAAPATLDDTLVMLRRLATG